MAMDHSVSTVLVVDDDCDIAEIVRLILIDEGFRVSVLPSGNPDVIRVAVNRLEPDCVLLDGEAVGRYGQSWIEAAWLTGRSRRIPVIMFTAGQRTVDEAQAGTSDRAVAADFAGIIRKPFDLDELVEAVNLAIGRSVPFDTSGPAESERTAAMVARVASLGAADIHASTRREWMNFRTAAGTLVQVYYWQRDGVYYVLRYAESGGVAENVGQFYDLETALLLAVTVHGSE